MEYSLVKRGSCMIFLILLSVLILSACEWLKDPDDPIKQPGRPNVMQYATEMEEDQWSHKVANSIRRHGIPSYSMRSENKVEIQVLFDNNVDIQKAKAVSSKYGAIVLDELDQKNTFIVVIPQINFWGFVKDNAVLKVGIKQPPQKYLDQMRR